MKVVQIVIINFIL